MPSKKKFIMHIVVLLGFVVFLGGLDLFRGMISESGPFSNPWAGLSKLMMLMTGACFFIPLYKVIYMCSKTAKKINNSLEIS